MVEAQEPPGAWSQRACARARESAQMCVSMPRWDELLKSGSEGACATGGDRKQTGGVLGLPRAGSRGRWPVPLGVELPAAVPSHARSRKGWGAHCSLARQHPQPSLTPGCVGKRAVEGSGLSPGPGRTPRTVSWECCFPLSWWMHQPETGIPGVCVCLHVYACTHGNLALYTAFSLHLLPNQVQSSVCTELR